MDFRNIILGSNDVVIEKVPIPEWNTEVYVRTISGTERDHFEQSCVRQVKKLRKNRMVSETKLSMDNVRAKLACIAICKGPDDPTRVFTDSDVEALSKKSAVALNRIYEVAARLAGINDDDIEELLGN